MNDLISKKQLANRINNYFIRDESGKVKLPNIINDVVFSIKECVVRMPVVEVTNGWISCEESMPEDNRPVLCYVTSTTDEGKGYMIGSCEHGVFWFLKIHGGMRFSFPNIQLKVTHWQPLPEPPEESE